jgi:hypothetical protein
MLATHRRDKIMALLQEDGSAKVLDLAKLVNIGIADVSATRSRLPRRFAAKIFRDLDQLYQLNTRNKTILPSENTNMKAWYLGWQHAISNGV